MATRKLAELPFSDDRTTEILKAVKRYVPDKLEEIKRDFADTENLIPAEIKAFYWIARSKEKSTVHTSKLLNTFQTSVILACHTIALMGDVLERLKESPLCNGAHGLDEIIVQLCGSSDPKILSRIISFKKELRANGDECADIESMWELFAALLR